jgi:hypothetical protein
MKQLYARFVLWMIRPALDEHQPEVVRDAVNATRRRFRLSDPPETLAWALGRVPGSEQPEAYRSHVE